MAYYIILSIIVHTGVDTLTYRILKLQNAPLFVTVLVVLFGLESACGCSPCTLFVVETLFFLRRVHWHFSDLAHKHTAESVTVTAVKAIIVTSGIYILCKRLMFVLFPLVFPDKLLTALAGSEVALIFTVNITVTISVNLTVERRQDDIDDDTVTVTVFDGLMHTGVELSRVECPGTMAKVDELEHRVESCKSKKRLGEYTTKHFGIRVGISELLTCIWYSTIVSLFV